MEFLENETPQQRARRQLGIKGYAGNQNGYVNPFSGESVTLVIDNAAPASDGKAPVDQFVAISEGYYEKASQMKDFSEKVTGIVDDGIFISATSTSTAVTASGQGANVIDIRKTFIETPCRIKGVRVMCKKTDQLDEALQVYELGPHRPKQIITRTPSASKSETENDQTRVSVDFSNDTLVLGKDRVFLYKVQAGAKVSLVFYFDDRMSQVTQLENAIATGLI
ncbi:MAG: hypothetical protein LBU90_03740 [Bacteroidales bacterium]|jgi:hypothetical protein|nr:hypothetical protein [Bacteroidales bacterium]